jgi:hypothetical protein
LKQCPIFAALLPANALDGKSDDEVRTEMGDKFPKHVYHSIACIGALIAHHDGSNCRVQLGQQSIPQVRGGPSLSIVDGLALYGHLRLESQAYPQYQCNPSDKFPGFTWCHKEKTERTNRGEITSSNSILHSQEGEAVYVNRYIEPAFFGPNDVRSEIDRLSIFSLRSGW